MIRPGRAHRSNWDSYVRMMYRLLLVETAPADDPASGCPALRRFRACRSAYVRMSKETLPPAWRAERSICRKTANFLKLPALWVISSTSVPQGGDAARAVGFLARRHRARGVGGVPELTVRIKASRPELAAARLRHLELQRIGSRTRRQCELVRVPVDRDAGHFAHYDVLTCLSKLCGANGPPSPAAHVCDNRTKVHQSARRPGGHYSTPTYLPISTSPSMVTTSCLSSTGGWPIQPVRVYVGSK